MIVNKGLIKLLNWLLTLLTLTAEDTSSVSGGNVLTGGELTSWRLVLTNRAWPTGGKGGSTRRRVWSQYGIRGYTMSGFRSPLCACVSGKLRTSSTAERTGSLCQLSCSFNSLASDCLIFSFRCCSRNLRALWRSWLKALFFPCSITGEPGGFQQRNMTCTRRRNNAIRFLWIT